MSALNTTEPVLPPPGLHLEALNEWRRIVKLLRDRGLLDGLEQIALRDFVTCWVRLEAAETDISKRGILLTTARGTIKNPSLQIAEQYREFLLSWARELGFTPVSERSSHSQRRDPRQARKSHPRIPRPLARPESNGRKAANMSINPKVYANLFLCEALFEGQKNKFSAINVLNKFVIDRLDRSKQSKPVSFVAVASLYSDASLETPVTFRAVSPKGAPVGEETRTDCVLVAGAQGGAVVAHIRMLAEKAGDYWIQLLVAEQLINRTPLRVTFSEEL